MTKGTRTISAACLFLVAAGSATAQAPAEAEKITVLVAKKKIPAWTYVKRVEDLFELQEKSRDKVPKNALLDLKDKDIKDGFRVARDFSEGVILTRDDLISKAMEGGNQIQPGPRAISIKASAESLVGGFVQPGSKVDVLWIVRTPKGESWSMIILENMLIQAVDTKVNRDKPEKIQVSTVTLVAKPEEAQKLALASGNGELRLLLRSPGDDKILRTEPLEFKDLEKPRVEPKPEEKVQPNKPREGKEDPASIIPPGLRGMTIRVDPESPRRGWVFPGSKVDVDWTPSKKKGEAESKTIVKNLLVLDFDTLVDREKPQKFVLSTVTLAVTPEQAQILALAGANGELMLALTGNIDGKKLRLPGARPEDLAVEEDKVPAKPQKEKQEPASIVPPGMRAFALRIANDEATLGFILPGARVDLIGVERKGPDTAVAKTVLENLLVLAVDNPPRGEKRGVIGSTITVAVTPAEALKLSQAAEKGEIRAALRRPEVDKKQPEGK